MALPGTAAVAMWWQLAPDKRAEFEDWHSHEHFPERMGIPGFLRGSRWEHVDNTHHFFVLYELEGYDVLTSPGYMERLNAPTPWSTKMMPHHQGMVRSQCTVELAHGGGMGTAVLAIRCAPAPGQGDALQARLAPVLATLPHQPGITATDIVLALTEFLRKERVVGAYVEFFGEGADSLSIGDRATISNMCPEYGATAAMFYIDQQTIDYLKLTGREPEQVALVEQYAKETGLWADALKTAQYERVLRFDLSTVVRNMAGPSNPNRRLPTRDLAERGIADAALHAHGWRTPTSRPGHHQTTTRCLVHTVDVPPATVRILDALRKQRNLSDYEGDPVAAATLQAALQAADKLLAHAESWLRQHHPEWKLA